MQWPTYFGLGTTETIALLALTGIFVVLAVLLLVVRARRRRRLRRRTGAAPAVPQTSPVARAAPPTVTAGGMPSPPPMVPAPAAAQPPAPANTAGPPPAPVTPPMATPPPPIPAPLTPAMPATPSPAIPATPTPAIPATPTPAIPAVTPAARPASVPGAAPGVVSLSEAELAQALRQRLGGVIGDAAHTAPSSAPDRVVWVEGGDELLVHLDSLRVQLLDRILLASLDLETDQTGRQTIVVPFAFAREGGLGGLVAVTEAAPRGDVALVARWGHTVQEAIWAALLSLARDAAAAGGQVPLAIAAVPGSLRLRGGPPGSRPVPHPVTHPAG